MKRLCFALDLKDDPQLIAEYEAYHQRVWPEILESIRQSGIRDMEIYRIHNRLFMIMDTDDDFSLAQKAEQDANNPKVQEWEELMWTYQKALPGAKPDEKWMPMKCIFTL
mgnify:CR=1 FL=1